MTIPGKSKGKIINKCQQEISMKLRVFLISRDQRFAKHLQRSSIKLSVFSI